MAIYFPLEEPIYTRNTTVAFRAMLNDVTVVCEISTEALRDHFGATTVNPKDIIAAFQAHRSDIEIVARLKLTNIATDRCLIVSADFP